MTANYSPCFDRGCNDHTCPTHGAGASSSSSNPQISLYRGEESSANTAGYPIPPVPKAPVEPRPRRSRLEAVIDRSSSARAENPNQQFWAATSGPWTSTPSQLSFTDTDGNHRNYSYMVHHVHLPDMDDTIQTTQSFMINNRFFNFIAVHLKHGQNKAHKRNEMAS